MSAANDRPLPPNSIKGAVKPTVSLVPFGNEYYKGHFRNIAPEGFSKIYEKFAKFQEAAAKAPPPGRRVDRFQKMASADLEKIYKRFPKWQEASTKAPPLKALESSKAPTFQFNPSVGTWLAKPIAVQVPKPKGDAKFKFAPSVGTWLQPITPEEEPEPRAADRQKSAFLPSVGTWLSPIQYEAPLEVQEEKPPFALSPSVGTWLSTRLPDQDSNKARHFVPLAVQYGTQFYNCKIRPGYRVL